MRSWAQSSDSPEEDSPNTFRLLAVFNGQFVPLEILQCDHYGDDKCEVKVRIWRRMQSVGSLICPLFLLYCASLSFSSVQCLCASVPPSFFCAVPQILCRTSLMPQLQERLLKTAKLPSNWFDEPTNSFVFFRPPFSCLMTGPSWRSMPGCLWHWSCGTMACLYAALWSSCCQARCHLC